MGGTTQAGRRTREELRTLMLEAGTELFSEVAPTMGFEHLTYKRVFEHLLDSRNEKVTIGSVHERIWPGLREYQLDVLTAVLAGLPQKGFDVSNGGLLEWFKNADLVTVSGRRYAVQNATRLFANLAWGDGHPLHRIEATWYDARFRLWTLGDDHPEANQVRELVTDLRNSTHQLQLEALQVVMSAVRLRERAHVKGLGADMVALIGNGVTTGLLTDPLAVARTPRLLPTGLNGEDEEWMPSALASWATVQSLLELDGDDLTDHERRL